MKNIKKEILILLGALGGFTLVTVTKGVAMPAVLTVLAGLGATLSTEKIKKMSVSQIQSLFTKFHPNQLNHSIKKLFVQSVNDALYNINILFGETQATENEKKEAGQLIQMLQKHLPKMLLNSSLQLDEPEIKSFLYEKDADDAICDYIKSEFASFGIAEPFQSFLAQNLSAQIQLCFGEELKENNTAWVAFQRMLIEEIRYDIKQIADTQQSLKDDLSDLKFEKSGFSEEQITEIREFIKLLNNKNLIEVKIRNGVNQSLKSIESKANEIIQIATKNQLTVVELKSIIEKNNRQNRINQIIIYSLALGLLIAGSCVAYFLVNKPFTAIVKVYGWEGEQHNPLNEKGTIVLTLGDEIKKAEINLQNGEAVFRGILPKFNNTMVTAKITDVEEMPYYLCDSTIKIQRNDITKVQVLLRGLEKLEGQIVDNISGEGLFGATVSVVGIRTITDEQGYFCIEIPIEKQKLEQEIEIFKEGYCSKRQTIPIVGEHKHRTILERQ